MPSSGVQTCALDRKSTRLNSSHTIISYAVFCLKKTPTAGGQTHPSPRPPLPAPPPPPPTPPAPPPRRPPAPPRTVPRGRVPPPRCFFFTDPAAHDPAPSPTPPPSRS